MTQPFTPQDPTYKVRVRESFAKQHVMATIGATLTRVEPGEVEITLPYRGDLTQQHGFMHAGIIATIGDSACGYAAFTLMPAEAGVLSIEYKINLLAPAQGKEFRAVGRVVKAGRTITVVNAEVWADTKLAATLTGTMMTLLNRPNIKG